jgi:hypothetical protein
MSRLRVSKTALSFQPNQMLYMLCPDFKKGLARRIR